MKRQFWLGLILVLLLSSIASYYAYRKWSAHNSSSRGELLAMMPPDASAVVFVDLKGLRTASFFAKLPTWASRPQVDPEYAQFLRDTGFDYERDLDRIALAAFKNTIHPTFFAAARGRFDLEKISSYAMQRGKSNMLTKDVKFFIVPLSDGSEQLELAFPRKDQLLITNDGLGHEKLREALHYDPSRKEWSSRFDRLAGSPIFAVIRQDAAPGAALAQQAPGGLRSPQLSALLDQLQWITIAAKPEGDRLHIVTEGECTAEATTHQLADVLSGILVLADAGLNDAKTRQQLDPALRAAYLELLKSADVSKIDRGDTKSVRLAFEITPAFLEAAGRTPTVSPHANPKSAPGTSARSKKGHT